MSRIPFAHSSFLFSREIGHCFIASPERRAMNRDDYLVHNMLAAAAYLVLIWKDEKPIADIRASI